MSQQIKRLFPLISLGVSSLAFVACQNQHKSTETLTFARNNGDKVDNIYLGFSGNDDGIPGVHQDPITLQNMMNDPSLGFKFQTHTEKSATLKTMQDLSAQAAGSLLPPAGTVGPVPPRGTLFWAISSHGAANGATIDSQGRSFTFTAIASVMRKARGDVPFARLIVFFDTCYSGQNVDGRVAINNNTGVLGGGVASLSMLSSFASASWLGRGQPEAGSAGTALANMNSLADSLLQDGQNGLAQQFILIGASSKTQSSLDQGSAGGVGTNALRKAMTALRKGQRPPANAAQVNYESGDYAPLTASQMQSNDAFTDWDKSVSLALDEGTNKPGNPTTPIAPSSPAAPGTGAPCATVGDLEVSMRRFAVGQTPVVRVMPETLKNECLFDK